MTEEKPEGPVARKIRESKVKAANTPKPAAPVAPAPIPTENPFAALQQLPQVLQRILALQEQNTKDIQEMKAILKFLSPQR